MAEDFTGDEIAAELRLFHHNKAADELERLMVRVAELEAENAKLQKHATYWETLAKGHMDKSDALAAVIEKVREALAPRPGCQAYHSVGEGLVWHLISAVPSDVLAEVKAAAWDEGWIAGDEERALLSERGVRQRVDNPYREA
jgi:hypothetical protein